MTNIYQLKNKYPKREDKLGSTNVKTAHKLMLVVFATYCFLVSCSKEMLSKPHITMDCSVDDVQYAGGIELNIDEVGDGLVKFTGGEKYQLSNRSIVKKSNGYVFSFDTNVEGKVFKMTNALGSNIMFGGAIYKYDGSGKASQGKWMLCVRTDDVSY